jgi:hypothetical protein
MIVSSRGRSGLLTLSQYPDGPVAKPRTKIDRRVVGRTVGSPGMTTDILVHRHGVPTLVCAVDGPELRDERDAVDVIGMAFQHEADPVERLAEDFFTLSTGVAGGIVQKFVNYRLRLAIVGDISRFTAVSAALRDFVAETNRGKQLWFVETEADLDTRLS